MPKLTDRQIEVRVGLSGVPGRVWRGDGLSIEFSVEHESGREANKASVQLWNLSDASVGFIENLGGNGVLLLLAGYGAPQLIFKGRLRPKEVRTEYSKPDKVTSLVARDGDFEFRAARFNAAYDGVTTAQEVLADVASSMALGLYIDPELALPPSADGPFFMGSAREALDQVLAGGASWSIQDGQLTILARGSKLPEQAVVLSPASGLIGSPEVTDEGLRVRSLLMPMIRPGRIVAIDSARHNGFYRVEKVTHSGASRGDNFFTDMEVTKT